MTYQRLINMLDRYKAKQTACKNAGDQYGFWVNACIWYRIFDQANKVAYKECFGHMAEFRGMGI